MEEAEKKEASPQSFGSVFREVATSVKDIVQSEGALVKAEIEESTDHLEKLTDSLKTKIEESTLHLEELTANLKTEVEKSTTHLGKLTADLGKMTALAAIGGGLLAISVLPALAFLVTWFARMLDNNFLFSFLIVAALCAAIGGRMTFLIYNKVKRQDFSHPKSPESIDRSSGTMHRKKEELRDISKRRAA